MSLISMQFSGDTPWPPYASEPIHDSVVCFRPEQIYKSLMTIYYSVHSFSTSQSTNSISRSSMVVLLAPTSVG